MNHDRGDRAAARLGFSPSGGTNRQSEGGNCTTERASNAARAGRSYHDLVVVRSVADSRRVAAALAASYQRKTRPNAYALPSVKPL